MIKHSSFSFPCGICVSVRISFPTETNKLIAVTSIAQWLTLSLLSTRYFVITMGACATLWARYYALQRSLFGAMDGAMNESIRYIQYNATHPTFWARFSASDLILNYSYHKSSIFSIGNKLYYKWILCPKFSNGVRNIRCTRYFVQSTTKRKLQRDISRPR